MSDTPGACAHSTGQTLSKRRAPTSVLMPQTWLSNKFPDGSLVRRRRLAGAQSILKATALSWMLLASNHCASRSSSFIYVTFPPRGSSL